LNLKAKKAERSKYTCSSTLQYYNIYTRAVQQRLINQYLTISFRIQSVDSLTDYLGGIKLVD